MLALGRPTTAATCRGAGGLCIKNANCCTGICDTANPDPTLRNRCACPQGTENCRGACREPASYQGDVSNCSGCGVVCPGAASGLARCENGVCLPICNEGTHLCGSTCYPDVDPTHCGPSCAECPVPEHAGATCVAGACDFFCDEGWDRCNGRCLDLPIVLSPDPRTPFVDTGLFLNAGDSVIISVTGTVDLDGIPDTTHLPNGPAGHPDEPNCCSWFCCGGFFCGSAVGRIGTGSIFLIGAGPTVVTASTAGQLFVGICDNNYPDNALGFTYTIDCVA